jgi:hypothetical protein
MGAKQCPFTIQLRRSGDRRACRAPGTPFPSQPPGDVETESRGETQEEERYATL